MMKKYTLSIFALLFIVHCYAQAPTWQWAKSEDASFGDNSAQSSATDALGNVYITGYFNDMMLIFGTDTLGNNNTGNCMFLVKYDNNGNELWAKTAEGMGQSFGNAVATDAFGNVYVTGSCIFPITFDTITLNGPSHGIFLTKYDTNGNALWAKASGGSFSQSPTAIAVDSSDNIFITGWFWNSSITFDTIVLSNAGVDDIFIVKYNSLGNVQWAKSAGGVNDDRGAGIAVDNSGNVFVAGSYSSASISFGSLLTNYTVAGGAFDVFLLKLDSNGNQLWASSAGNGGHDYATSVSVDVTGSAFVSGMFNGTSITFGSVVLNNAGFSGYAAMYIVKYNSVGTALWANTASGNFSSNATSTAVDISRNVYVAGNFYDSTITFGSTVLHNITPQLDDVYLVKYNATGVVQWAVSAGSESEDRANSTSIDAFGNVFLAGDYPWSPMYFGSISLTNPRGFKQSLYLSKLGISVVISEINNQQSTIKIYPNPATNNLTITFAEPQKNTTIKILNLLGKEIRNYELGMKNEKSINIDVSDVAKGMYFVQITDETKTSFTKKIIVQ